jgi:TolB-like protein/tRNA A-37 threonylcarbamoyl transferase component Bud32
VIGQTISHYQIVEKLGEGGMGVVYKAYDTALKRHVALKFLPAHLTRDEQARKRFVHEAQAAAALDHPNICPVYEIGQSDDQSFIVMPLLEGQSLRDKLEDGALPVNEALDVAIQMGRGLAKAHGNGIVHRDVKPGNVLLSEDGQVKIVDFGLAKLGSQTKLTKTGMTVGTVSYMSPEQATGEGVDHRTDVWSLGVMLYEMLAGRLPFRGEAEPAVVYSVLNQDPEPVTSIRWEVPVGLEDVVERALSKDVAKRYQTMDEMLAALETVQEESQLGITRRRYAALKRLRRRKRLLAGAVATMVVAIAAVLIATFYQSGHAIESIAVMPFANLSGDPEQEYYSLGVTESLINELSKIGALTVKSRTSAMKFKDTDKTLPEIAGELDVDAIIVGSVIISGGRLGIKAQLMRANPEGQMWADSFERDVTDVLVLLSEVARTIADEIKVTLTPRDQARLANVGAVDSLAYDLYLQGRYHYYKMTKEGAEKGIEYFQQAIEADSSYAPAYAMLAAAYEWYSFLGYLPPVETYAKCVALIEKALEIDDSLAEAYMALAGVKGCFLWDWEGGETQFERSFELDPDAADAHCEYSWLLMATGRTEEAFAEAGRCLELDPLWYTSNWVMAKMYGLARQYDRALAQVQRMVEMEPNDWRPYWELAAVYERLGEYEDAIEARRRAMTLNGAPPERIAAMDSACSESGAEGYWRWELKRLEGQYEAHPTYIAMVYAQLGDEEQAFEWLERAYEQHDGLLYLLKADPRWDPLRDDPRYEDLVRRMNFPG